MGTNDRIGGKTVIDASSSLTEIGLLVYPGSQMAAVLGLTDLFLVANRLSLEHGGSRARALRVSHWQLESGMKDPRRIFDTHQQKQKTLAALILPPSLGTEPLDGALDPLSNWLTIQHGAGTIVCSICGGVFVLAKTGLLDGRPATTHWTLSEALSTHYPRIQVDTNRLIIDDGDIITAGGVMAWVDLGLSLIDRFLSPTIMLATARFFLIDTSGRQQRFYSSFAPKLHHGDEAVLKSQHWLHAHNAESFTVKRMAAEARLGERTFLRRFQKATGLTPTKYVQHLRVAKAREALEFSSKSVSEVAWKVGYEDAGSFQKVFHKIMGLTPGDYRRRFSIARG
ncbi:MAG: GlxA family transcriptional regulator [Acidobacteriaceae bacterium]